MNSPECKLAVVFPVYNGEKTLKESLQCIADQDYRDFRAYIIENKSTDGSRAIAEEFCAKDPRFEIYNCEDHLGMMENFMRAFAVGAEKGQYFCLRACDDLSSLDYLSKLLNALENDADKLLAAGSTERIWPDHTEFLKPSEATVNFHENLKKGKVAKTLYFPAEWFYGVIRSKGGAEIFLRRWPEQGTPWCAASYTVAEIVMLGKVVWVDGPIYKFVIGSGSEDRYMEKTLSRKIAMRWKYAKGCSSVIDRLPPVSLLTTLRLFRLCWRDAGRKTRYRIRRHFTRNNLGERIKKY